MASAYTRRWLAGFLSGSWLSGLLVAIPDAASAKKKRGKKKKKRKGKGVPDGNGPLPPPPSPIEISCPLDTNSSVTGNQRVAQTFVAPQSGLLTKSEIFLSSNPANFDLTFEIRTVDPSGVPTSDILATRSVRVTATDAPDPPKLVPATFASPAAVTAGQSLALVVTAPDGDVLNIHESSGDPCPDGKLYVDQDATDNFEEFALGTADVGYTVTIVV